MNLESLESSIKKYARIYSPERYLIEDYEQIGRIAAWQLLEKNPEPELPLMLSVIKNTIRNQKTYDNAKKRKPKTTISINQPLGHDGDEEFYLDISSTDDNLAEVGLAGRDILEILKKNYGRTYLLNIILSEAKPKLIINRAVRALILDVAGIPINDVSKKVNYQFFLETGFQNILWTFYNNSPAQAIQDAFPGQFEVWNLAKVPQKYWKGKRGLDRAKQAMVWFAKRKEIRTAEDCKNITGDDFKAAGLSGMLQRVFQDSTYFALYTIFPDLKPWNVKQTSATYFNFKINRKYALTNYLSYRDIGDISELTAEETYDTDIRRVGLKDRLNDYGLRGLLNRYNNSTYDLFTDIFPEQILPWTLNSKKAWENNPLETAALAVRWLYEKYLKIPVEEIPQNSSWELFQNVGFLGIITNRNIGFNGSHLKAIHNAYPNTFKETGTGTRKRLELI